LKVMSNVEFAVIFSRQTRMLCFIVPLIGAVATTEPFFLREIAMSTKSSDVKNMKKSTVLPPFTQNLAKLFSVLVILKLLLFRKKKSAVICLLFRLVTEEFIWAI